MHKHCSNVCQLCQCLDKESKNSAHMRTIVTAPLQRQYSQTELTFWITYVYHVWMQCTIAMLIHSCILPFLFVMCTNVNIYS
jgi:hypothetical protein